MLWRRLATADPLQRSGGQFFISKISPPLPSSWRKLHFGVVSIMFLSIISIVVASVLQCRSQFRSRVDGTGGAGWHKTRKRSLLRSPDLKKDTLQRSAVSVQSLFHESRDSRCACQFPCALHTSAASTSSFTCSCGFVAGTKRCADRTHRLPAQKSSGMAD